MAEGGKVGAMLERVSVGTMLLALLDRGSESPMPTSWPARAPVAGFMPDGAWAKADTAVMPSNAAVAIVRERMLIPFDRKLFDCG